MTTINRYNYEAFFLLYIDGELSAAEKQAVDQFVQENPDLAAELDKLRQTLLLPDESIQFANKERLYKAGSQVIALTNYEEKFLSYIDNELTGTEKQSVETFVLQHPALQADFISLQQTKLEATTIEFPDKQSLYRTAKTEKPVVYLRWWSVAAAAAVIGLGVMVWTLLPRNDRRPENLAVSKTQVLPSANQRVESTHSNDHSQPAAQNNSNTEDITPALNNSTQQATASKQALPVTNKDHNSQVFANSQNTGSERRAAETVTTKTGADAENNIINAPMATTRSTGADIKSIITPTIDNNAASGSIAQQPVYKELDTDDDSKSLYLGSVELNKDKLRGLFRKASSIFKSKAAREEEDNTRSPK